MGDSHTAGPWHVEPVTDENGEQFWSDDWNGKVFCVCHPLTQCDATCVVHWIREGDARLIAAAPDHALVAKAMTLGIARWDNGELCFGGMRYSTTLDEFGVPVLAAHTRGDLRAAIDLAVKERERG